VSVAAGVEAETERACSPSYFTDGKDIVAVYADCVNAIACTAAGDAIAAVLF
jgi:hypothetical protein